MKYGQVHNHYNYDSKPDQFFTSVIWQEMLQQSLLTKKKIQYNYILLTKILLQISLFTKQSEIDIIYIEYRYICTFSYHNSIIVKNNTVVL